MAVRKQRRMLPRCVGTTRDGSQCGRRASDDTIPALCHIHRALANGQHAPLTEPVFDPLNDLRKLARSSDERVRLRAIDLLIELERKAAERRDAKSASGDGPTGTVILAAMTDKERARVRHLCAQLREIQGAVFERRPDLRPAGWGADVVSAPASCAPHATNESPAPSVADTHATEVDDTLGPDEVYLDEL